MTETKRLRDFAEAQWPDVELREPINHGTEWHVYKFWEHWPVSSARAALARLVKREAKSVTLAAHLRTIPEFEVHLDTKGALNRVCREWPDDLPVSITVTELIDGAEPETDWRAECERLTKKVNRLALSLEERTNEANDLARACEAERRTGSDRDKRIAELEIEVNNNKRRVTDLESSISTAYESAEDLRCALRKAVDGD